MKALLPRFVVPDLDAAKPARRRKPIMVDVGSVSIPIYRTRWTKKGKRRIYTTHVIVWRDAAGRHREKHADLEKAKARAEIIGTNLLNGQTAQNQFTEADRASYLRSCELVQPTGKALEVAAGIYTECVQILGGRCSPQEACRFYIETQPKGLTPKIVPKLVQDLLDEKRRLRKGEKWLGTLEQQLGKFADQFNCPLHLVQAREISTWLDGLKVGLRSRKNYRDAVRELVRFAQAKGYLSRAWDELSHVEDADLPPVEVVKYSPDQIKRLLNTRLDIEAKGKSGATLIPFLALAAFAGVRHEEMHQRGNHKPVLDWSCIDLEAGLIRIQAIVGKTKRQRVIPMHRNLVEWLKPYAKDSGPICELNQVAGALDRAKKLAGLPNGRGKAKNVLRKSFISYRLAETNDIGLTAREAGNSPQVIKNNYEQLATGAEAAEHFAITPMNSLPLLEWGAKQCTRK
jgi:integrase